MTCEGFTPAGATIFLGEPLSIKISRDADAPADGLTAEFPHRSLPDLCRVRIWDGGTLYFSGIVDEQHEILALSGMTVKISARGMAAPLLDSEALPQTYRNPSLPSLYNRHAAPFGLAGCRGPTNAACGEMTVEKGTSDWQMLEQFCREFLKTSPRVTVEGIFDASGKPCRELRFGTSGIPYYALEYRRNWYPLLSDVYVQTEKGGAYTACLHGELARQHGILRKRYLSVSASASAEKLLADSVSDSLELRVRCYGWYDAEPGDTAEIDCPAFGNLPRARVQGASYSLDSSGKTCTIFLKGGVR